MRYLRSLRPTYYWLIFGIIFLVIVLAFVCGGSDGVDGSEGAQGPEGELRGGPGNLHSGISGIAA